MIKVKVQEKMLNREKRARTRKQIKERNNKSFSVM
jgi:hypothetical protein